MWHLLRHGINTSSVTECLRRVFLATLQNFLALGQYYVFILHVFYFRQQLTIIAIFPRDMKPGNKILRGGPKLTCKRITLTSKYHIDIYKSHVDIEKDRR